MKEYELPKEWYIEITDENIEIVNDWKLKQQYNNCLIGNRRKYVDFDGNSGNEFNQERRLKTKITTDQFIQYVLKQDVFPKNWAIRQNVCQEACDWFNETNNLNINKTKYANLEGAYTYITFNGNFTDKLDNYVEITKKQFIKHVLKPQKHNYSKLINILKFIDGSSTL